MQLEYWINGELRTIQLGLANSDFDADKDYSALDLLGQRSWIARATDHIVEYLRKVFTGTEVRVTAQYPQAVNQEQITQLKLPMIVVNVSAGPSRELNVGMVAWMSDRVAAYGYNQVAYVSIDVWARSNKDAVNICSIASQHLVGEGKRTYLRHRGFQGFRADWSDKGQTGFEFWRNYIYNPNFVTIELFRHCIYHSTSFDVVWRYDPQAYGIITQITLSGTDIYGWEDILGIRMDRLYLEDIYLDWFDIGV